MTRPQPRFYLFALCLGSLALAGCQSIPTMEGGSIPPKSEWTATASARQNEFFPARYACDGRPNTRWSSPAEDPHWIQFDMGSEATICGFRLAWETAYSTAYNIDVSQDGKSWKTVYATTAGDGKTDNIFIEPVNARYFKLFASKRGTGWGHSLWEIDVRGPEHCIAIDAPGKSVSHLMDGRLDTVWSSGGSGPVTLSIDLKKEEEFGGLRIDWGDNYATAYRMYVSRDGRAWQLMDELREGTGVFDLTLHPKTKAQFIRLELLQPAKDAPYVIREVSVRGPDEVLTQLATYEVAAQKAARGAYPLQLRGEQVYWTTVGLPKDSQESIVDEYGNVEPYAGSCSLMPYIYMDDRLLSAVDADDLSQSLPEGHLPMPIVNWSVDGLDVRAQAMTRGDIDTSVTFIRYRVANASDAQKSGKVFLAVRPVQINPPWQYGGLSPIHAMEFVREQGEVTVKVNERDAFVSLTPASDFGAKAFEFGDIVKSLMRGEIPDQKKLEGAGDLISGALAYDFDLAPGEHMDITVAAPLHDDRAPIRNFRERAAQDPTAGLSGLFDEEWAQAKLGWKSILDRVGIDLPEKDVIETLLAQIGYILINQDGVAIQPGSRNYKRCWIRDGGVTSVALMRLGLFDEAREFLDWYAQRVREDGLVPPILNTDGSVYDGFGSNLEYDSQGQFIYCIVEYYRFTRDREFLERHFDNLVKAAGFMEALRNKTLLPKYMQDQSARERFVGILPKSISHEGYSPPMHSYWDNFWALRGWRDMRYAAEVLDHQDKAQWAVEQHDLLADSVSKTLRAVIDFKEIDYIPGAAELGDLDATSTAIAFSPCDVAEVAPPEELQNTFDRYYADLQKRLDPAWSGRFTPYEVRSINAFVALGQKDRAKMLLDFILDSRRPKAWKHLAEVVISDYRIGSYIGDMPHTWVGSGYVNAVREMIIKERGTDLILFAGVPAVWLEGEGIEIDDMPTHFGKLTISATSKERMFETHIAGELDADRIQLTWPMEQQPTRVVVDGQPWSDFDESVCRLPPTARHVVATW